MFGNMIFRYHQMGKAKLSYSNTFSIMKRSMDISIVGFG